MTGLSWYDRYAPVGTMRCPLTGGHALWRKLGALFRKFARLYTDDEVLEGGLDFGKVQGDSG